MTKKKKFKVIDLVIDEDLAATSFANSFVSDPAIEREFIAFNKAKTLPYKFTEEGDQHLVIGAFMVPDLPIARYDDEGKMYFVRFRPEQIDKAIKLFAKYQRGGETKVDHAVGVGTKAHLIETWRIGSTEDKFYSYGFDRELFPPGTWVGIYHVPDAEMFQLCKSGHWRGFSIESMFRLGEETIEEFEEEFVWKEISIDDLVNDMDLPEISDEDMIRSTLDQLVNEYGIGPDLIRAVVEQLLQHNEGQ
jgi:hypothetical protein